MDDGSVVRPIAFTEMSEREPTFGLSLEIEESGMRRGILTYMLNVETRNRRRWSL